MKKNYFLTALMMLFIGAGSAMADTYKVDFNTTIDTNDHSFRVATGWTHIVDAYEHPIWSSMSEWVAYSYSADGGVDGTGALKVGSQLLMGAAKNDLLVTPKVNGEVSLMVKSASEYEDQTPSVKFFAVADG